MKKIFGIAVGIFIFTTAFTGQAFADESMQRFDSTIVVDKSGKIFVEEIIAYNFGENSRHGIFRYIPTLKGVGKLYKVSPISVTKVLRDGKDEEYSVTKNNYQLQIKIGDPNVLLSGLHSYIIDYTVSNIIGNFTDHDEIYWNVTGNDWNVPIPIARVSVYTNFNLTPVDAVCYTGVAGSKSSDCSISSVKNGVVIVTTQPLKLTEGFSVAVSFPPHTFPSTILQKDYPSTGKTGTTVRYLQIAAVVYFLLNFLLAPFLFFWYKRHKHKNRFGPVSVNFEIPSGPDGARIIPAEAGSIDNAKLDKDDIIATIFDLAIRKYITIQAVKKENFLAIGSHEQYSATKIKSFDDLSGFEKKVATVIFNGGETVEVRSVKFTYEDFSDLEEKNFASLVKKGIYTKNPKIQMANLLTLGIILTLTLNVILGPFIIFLSRKLNGRTQVGDTLDFKIDGLKLFLKNMAREYKWQAEKAYVVEQMIPYAISLGLISDFMKQLKILNPNYQPSWYSGNNFYAAYPYFYSSFGGAIVTTSSSSGSGFSGGFSGGGGGGGGGGSW